MRSARPPTRRPAAPAVRSRRGGRARRPRPGALHDRHGAPFALLAIALGAGCGTGGFAPGAHGPGPITLDERTTMTDTPAGAPGKAAAAPSGTLAASLRVASPAPSVDAPLEVVVATRNASDGTLSLLLWNTPFEAELSADVFRVTRDGEPVPYRGRLVRRAVPPPPDAVASLGPGDTLARTVTLSRHYALDVPGTYSIALAPRPPVADPAPGSPGFATLVAADAAALTVERR